MRLALIFDRHRPDTTGIYFERACRALGIPVDHWWFKDAERIPSGETLYLRIDHGDDYRPLPARLRPAAFYAIDTHLRHSWPKIRRMASAYDLVCCAQPDAARRLKNGLWVPLGCDVELHAAASPGEPVWDVAFVGTEGGVPRKFYLQALRERYPNSRIGWAPHTELGAVYSHARIGFNYAVANDVNMRLFEVLCAGALLVTNRLAGDALEQLGLRDRQHLATYRTPRELFEAIDHFLAEPQQRRSIASAGAAVVRTRHTYAHRLRQILAAARVDVPGSSVPSQAVEQEPSPAAER